MRALADENFPGPLLRALRQHGWEVESVRESKAGASDRAVLEWAAADSLLVLTFDKDFGELAFRHQMPASCGVVLFRLTGSSPTADNARAFAALVSRTDWPGHFSVITEERIRMRALAPASV